MQLEHSTIKHCFLAPQVCYKFPKVRSSYYKWSRGWRREGGGVVRGFVVRGFCIDQVNLYTAKKTSFLFTFFKNLFLQFETEIHT